MEGEEKATAEQLKDVPAAALAEAERPLIGTAEENGVIDPDVLWSCTTCGACVEQCPVDIEHIDHIVDMRRYQVMIESAFPSEAGTMLKNLEKKGNPWGLAKKQRAGVDQGGRLRGPGRRQGRRGPHRGRLPVLGRLRGRPGGPGQEDHQGLRGAAAHRGRQVRDHGRRREVHR